MSPVPIRDTLNMNSSISPGSLKARIHERIDKPSEHGKNYNNFMNNRDRKVIERVKDEDLKRIMSDGDAFNENKKPKNFELPTYDTQLNKKRENQESDTKQTSDDVREKKLSMLQEKLSAVDILFNREQNKKGSYAGLKINTQTSNNLNKSFDINTGYNLGGNQQFNNLSKKES